MKTINLVDLAGYNKIFSVPSYDVMEHPETFHTMIVYHRRVTRHPERVQVCAEGKLPGLKDDPALALPAGMLREIVKKFGKKKSTSYIQDARDPRDLNNVRLRVDRELRARVPRPVVREAMGPDQAAQAAPQAWAPQQELRAPQFWAPVVFGGIAQQAVNAPAPDFEPEELFPAEEEEL